MRWFVWLLASSLAPPAPAEGGAGGAPWGPEMAALLVWANSSSSEPYRTPCWGERDKGRRTECCNGALPEEACFDKLFRRRECCTDGMLLLLPKAKGDDPRVRMRAGAAGMREHHPAFSAEQARFQRLNRRGSVMLSLNILGVDLKVMTWRRQQRDVMHVADDLALDVYRMLEDRSRPETASPHGGGPEARRFVDIGANYGLVSMLFARLNPGSTVLAAEPAAEIFRYFLWNLKLNNLTGQVWPLNTGIGDEACRRVVYPSSALYSGPFFTSAPCVSLGSFLSSFGLDGGRQIDVLKVDCEGCEYSTFGSQQSRDLARRRVRRFAGEVHAWCFECGRLAGSRAFAETLSLLCSSAGGGLNPAVEDCSGVMRGGSISLRHIYGRLLPSSV